MFQPNVYSKEFIKRLQRYGKGLEVSQDRYENLRKAFSHILILKAFYKMEDAAKLDLISNYPFFTRDIENIYDNVRLILERLENEFPDFNVSGFEEFLKNRESECMENCIQYLHELKLKYGLLEGDALSEKIEKKTELSKAQEKKTRKIPKLGDGRIKEKIQPILEPTISIRPYGNDGEEFRNQSGKRWKDLQTGSDLPNFNEIPSDGRRFRN